MRVHALCALFLLLTASSAAAQTDRFPFGRSHDSDGEAADAAFMGAMIGSATLGLVGVVVASSMADDRCAPEWWACALAYAGIGGAVGSIPGAALGAIGGATMSGGKPSVGGALGGAIVGSLAGVAVGFTAALAFQSETPLVLGFVLTQATLTAVFACLGTEC